MAAALALALSLSARWAGGIELSLEENRAQRGNIGFVDMQRVFKLYPETLRAKETFEDAVRQAEDQVNLRKAEIIRRKGEVERLRNEREALARAIPPEPPPAPAPSTAPYREAAIVGSTSVVTELLPGLPLGTTLAAAVAETPPSAMGPTPPEGSRSPHPEGAPPPGKTELAELDSKLARLSEDLKVQEGSLKDHQDAAEKNLLDLESRKTEILLGKIHRVIQDIARREGISVVVDKNNILYGHDAVDLTEKVLQTLKGS